MVTGERLITAMSTQVRISIDSFSHHVLSGRIFISYFDTEVAFDNEMELLRELEGLFDTLSFPQRFQEYRHFSKIARSSKPSVERKRKTMSDVQGDGKATFVVHVQFRRNATWQGTIQWVDGKKRQTFRSTLEMIRLMDEAMEETCGEPRIDWEMDEAQ